jgi:hypothetical protein
LVYAPARWRRGRPGQQGTDRRPGASRPAGQGRRRGHACQRGRGRAGAVHGFEVGDDDIARGQGVERLALWLSSEGVDGRSGELGRQRGVVGRVCQERAIKRFLSEKLVSVHVLHARFISI